ncbi:MAG: hypothetical protein AAF438_16590 [Pseudomonadota bacterium]
MYVRRRHDTMVSRVLFSLALLLGAVFANAQDTSPFDTLRMVEGTSNQCRGVPDCITEKHPWVNVGPEQSVVVGGNCPDVAPYVWHWDARYQEHLSITVLGRTQNNLSFRVENRGEEAGRARIWVGCSVEVFDPYVRGYETYSAGVPSLNLLPQ